MDYLLNTHTATLHEPREESGDPVAACGALMHVPPERVERVAASETGASDASRCGRCFSDAGGY